MTQSMIGFLVGLAVILAVAVMLTLRYMRDHKGEGMVQRLDAHYMG